MRHLRQVDADVGSRVWQEVGSLRVRRPRVVEDVRQEGRREMNGDRQRVTADIAAVVNLWMNAEITCAEMVEKINMLSSLVVATRCPACGGRK